MFVDSAGSPSIGRCRFCTAESACKRKLKGNRVGSKPARDGSMSRPLRIEGEGLTYHVCARGNGKMTIFCDETDFRCFERLLSVVVAEQEIVCHAECRMTNHYHLVFTTLRANLSRAMHALNGEYAQAWNRRHAHVGHVLQGRFHCQLVQDEIYLATVCRYVVLNPVRAGLVASPEEWAWSSYRACAGMTAVPSYLSPRTLFGCLGATEAGERVYREFVTNREGDKSLPHDSILGDERFQARFSVCLEQAHSEAPFRERVARPLLERLFAGATSHSGRNRAIAEAHAAGYSCAEVARFVGLHRTAVWRVVAFAPRDDGHAVDPARGGEVDPLSGTSQT
jgi:REP element-mobilizing transposase RayT